MKFISNASNPGVLVNLQIVSNVLKQDKAIRFVVPGNRITWKFADNTKRDAAYNLVITNMSITDILEA